MYTYKLLSCCTKFTPIINTIHAIPDTIKRVNKKDTIPFAQPKLLNFLFNDNILFLIGFKRRAIINAITKGIAYLNPAAIIIKIIV